MDFNRQIREMTVLLTVFLSFNRQNLCKANTQKEASVSLNLGQDGEFFSSRTCVH